MTPLSVVMPARSGRAMTAACLKSLFYTLQPFPGEVEVLLLDDASDPAYGLLEMYRQFADKLGRPVRSYRFIERQHYTGVFSFALARTTAPLVLFVSNDMQITPSFVREMLAVAALVPDAGTVRGSSQYTDSFPQHKVVPPLPMRDYEDILAFSAWVSSHQRLAWVEDHLFSGDAVLVRRALVDRIGVFDPDMVGYYSDLDYGLRAQRAGFRLVCAKGAWLHHEGAGHVKDEAALGQIPFRNAHEARRILIQADYETFRAKWDPSLPPRHEGVFFDFEALRATERRPRIDVVAFREVAVEQG